MKNKILTAALVLTASFATIIPSTASAACRSIVLRMTQSLEATSDRLLCEYREELDGRRACGTERELLQTFYSLERLTNDLRSSMENGDSPSCQARIYSAVKSTFCSAKSLSREVRVCGCVRELMACVDDAIIRIGSAGFAPVYEAPRYSDGYRGSESHYRGGHSERREPSRREPNRHEMIIGGILGLLGGAR